MIHHLSVQCADLLFTTSRRAFELVSAEERGGGEERSHAVFDTQWGDRRRGSKSGRDDDA